MEVTAEDEDGEREEGLEPSTSGSYNNRSDDIRNT